MWEKGELEQKGREGHEYLDGYTYVLTLGSSLYTRVYVAVTWMGLVIVI